MYQELDNVRYLGPQEQSLEAVPDDQTELPVLWF